MTAVEKTFKRSQLTMHKAEGCGALTLTEAGIVKQSVTQDTTAEGKALIEQNGVVTSDILELIQTENGGTDIDYKLRVITDQEKHVGKYIYQLKVQLTEQPTILKLIDIPIEIQACKAQTLSFERAGPVVGTADDAYQMSLHKHGAYKYVEGQSKTLSIFYDTAVHT